MTLDPSAELASYQINRRERLLRARDIAGRADCGRYRRSDGDSLSAGRFAGTKSITISP